MLGDAGCNLLQRRLEAAIASQVFERSSQSMLAEVMMHSGPIAT